MTVVVVAGADDDAEAGPDVDADDATDAETNG